MAQLRFPLYSYLLCFTVSNFALHIVHLTAGPARPPIAGTLPPSAAGTARRCDRKGTRGRARPSGRRPASRAPGGGAGMSRRSGAACTITRPTGASFASASCGPDTGPGAVACVRRKDADEDRDRVRHEARLEVMHEGLRTRRRMHTESSVSACVSPFGVHIHLGWAYRVLDVGAGREDDGAHARLLLVAGDADAVRGRLQHAWAPQERLRNHRGRDDLPLPLWRRACQARDGVPSAGSYAACRR